MSDEHIRPHQTIRTFAQDLAEARKNRGQSTTDGSSDDAIKTDAVVSTPPQSHNKAQAPQSTTNTGPTIVVSTDTQRSHITPSTQRTPSKQTTFRASVDDADFVPKKSSGGNVEKKTNIIVPKISVKKNSSPKRPNIGYDATIITDNKHKRFNLIKATKESLSSWFKALTFSRKKKSPVYTVPDTQRRKGIIQKATSKSGSIFTANSVELREKIKQRQQRDAAEKEAGELNWSPYTDSGFALLEAPEEPTPVINPRNVEVEFKQRVGATVSPIKSEPPVQLIPEVPVITPVPLAPVEPEFVPEPAQVEPVESAEQEIQTPPVEKSKRSFVSKKLPHIRIQSLNTNALAISIVAGLAITVVIFFVAKALFAYVSSVEPLVVHDSTVYLPSAVTNQVVVTQINSITDIPLQAGKLRNIDYIDTQLFMLSGQIVPPATIIAALKFQMEPSFTQSLIDVRFAQKDLSKPIIIFKFSDPETVLGGFLSWEDNMAQDLKEIYLLTNSNDSVFIDKTISGTDVRILQSVTGETLLVYGIVSSDTALITGSLETFTQVLNASFK